MGFSVRLGNHIFATVPRSRTTVFLAQYTRHTLLVTNIFSFLFLRPTPNLLLSLFTTCTLTHRYSVTLTIAGAIHEQVILALTKLCSLYLIFSQIINVNSNQALHKPVYRLVHRIEECRRKTKMSKCCEILNEVMNFKFLRNLSKTRKFAILKIWYKVLHKFFFKYLISRRYLKILPVIKIRVFFTAFLCVFYVINILTLNSLKYIAAAIIKLKTQGVQSCHISVLDSVLQSYGHNFPNIQDTYHLHNISDYRQFLKNDHIICKLLDYIESKKIPLRDVYMKKNIVIQSTANDFVFSHYKKFKLSKKDLNKQKKNITNILQGQTLNHIISIQLCLEKKQHCYEGEVIDLTEFNDLQFYKNNKNIEIIRNNKILFLSSYFKMLRLFLPMNNNFCEIPEIGTLIIDAIMACIQCSRLMHTMVFLMYYNNEIKNIYIDGHIVINDNTMKIFHVIVHKFKTFLNEIDDFGNNPKQFNMDDIPSSIEAPEEVLTLYFEKQDIAMRFNFENYINVEDNIYATLQHAVQRCEKKKLTMSFLHNYFNNVMETIGKNTIKKCCYKRYMINLIENNYVQRQTLENG
ncbi:hypothetical protein AGLY_014202 [Aphis glycines]|uniref:Uncharacterized protein n=1 Tax=Aphis glycines TaxID=307491 RepID=A0A6G0T5P7_APHGL|nr:hypothetical protein AGLY_014202 [Aphis glycines]